jgi:hypothetical protein
MYYIYFSIFLWNILFNVRVHLWTIKFSSHYPCDVEESSFLFFSHFSFHVFNIIFIWSIQALDLAILRQLLELSLKACEFLDQPSLTHIFKAITQRLDYVSTMHVILRHRAVLHSNIVLSCFLIGSVVDVIWGSRYTNFSLIRNPLCLTIYFRGANGCT